MKFFFVVSTFGRVGKTTLSRFVLGQLPGAQVIEIESGSKDDGSSVLIKADSNSKFKDEILKQVILSYRRAEGPTVFDVGDRDSMALLRQLNAHANLFKEIPSALIVPVVNDKDCAMRFELMDQDIQPIKAAMARRIVVRNLVRGEGSYLDGVVKWAQTKGYEIADHWLPASDVLDNTKNTEHDIQKMASTNIIERFNNHEAPADALATLTAMVGDAGLIVEKIRGLMEELSGAKLPLPMPPITIAAPAAAPARKSGR